MNSFTVTHDITQYTKAKLFAEVGKRTRTLLRFSTVSGAEALRRLQNRR